MYILHQTTGHRMAVFKRKTTSGETSEYHYRFMKAGKLFYGVCEGCYTKDEAERYEDAIREKASVLAQQKSVKALVENFRDELAGGEKMLLKDAFRISSEKPRRVPYSEKQLQSKKSRFGDFVAFMRAKHPDVKFVNQVEQKHAEEYISYIRKNGRYVKTVKSPQGNYRSKNTSLSPATLNRFLEELRGVFDDVAKQSGVLENPFADIRPVLEEAETREAFTEAELEKIIQRAPSFIFPIFIVGFFTALREGDIATLRWSDVLWEQGIIRRKLLKTGVTVEIPIMPPLADFLHKQEGIDAEFVLPEHAAMYFDNPSGISYRVKKFLEGIGIETTKRVEGRSRAVSIKDVHSLRHTFCYFAGVAGIPLVIVQSIVGHMTPEMTAHYTAHADRKAKREKLAALPRFYALVNGTKRKALSEQKRRMVVAAIMSASDDVIDRVAAMILPPKPKKSLLRSTEPEKSN